MVAASATDIAREVAEVTTPATRSGQERTFRPDVEGLRAIAVVLVLLDHAGLAALSGGYIGVDVFFVLSGYLITGLLVREFETRDTISLVRFYARRARRLLPAGTLVLVATVIFSYQYLGANRANRVAEDAQWSSLFASNFRFISLETDYWEASLPPSPLQHFWSLAVEEQFYAVWPALIIVVALIARSVSIRVKLAGVLTTIIAGSLAWSIYQTSDSAITAYFSPFPRAFELAAGALLAVGALQLAQLPRRFGVVISWLGAAGIIAAAVTFDSTTPFPGYAVAVPVIGTVLAVAGGTIAPGRGLETLLKHWPFQWIGKLSYSLYLWHWPVLVIAAGRAGHDLSLTENLLLCGVALLLSIVTYVVLENPVRNSSWLRARPAVISVVLGVCLVAVSFGVATWMLDRNETPAAPRQPAPELIFPTPTN